MATIRERINAHATGAKQRLRSRDAYVKGDHWQAGTGWVGPAPKSESVAATRMMDEIRKAFVIRNLVREVCTRHADAVAGREPMWTLTRRDADGDKKIPAERPITDPLTSWWDERNLATTIRKAVFDLMWAGDDESASSSTLRIYIPERAAPSGEMPRAPDLMTALDNIRVVHTDPMSSGILTDSDGEPIAGYYHYQDDDDREVRELTILERDLDEDLALLLTEHGWTATDPLATLLIQEGASFDGNIRWAAYPLGGRLLMTDLRRDALITNGSLTLQKQVNLAYTMASRNVVTGGFLERIIMNAEMPGKWVDDNGKEVAVGGTFVPDEVQVGAGTTNWLKGIPIEDDEGGIRGYSTPNVAYRDPVPVTTFVDTLQMNKMGFYEETQQAHILIATAATVSGLSREQAMTDFMTSLQPTVSAMQTAVRWALETTLALASHLQGNREQYDQYRAVATARITVTKPSSQETRDAALLRNERLISNETAMTRVGVEDTDAELDRIAREAADEANRAAADEPTITPGALRRPADVAQAARRAATTPRPDTPPRPNTPATPLANE